MSDPFYGSCARSHWHGHLPREQDLADAILGPLGPKISSASCFHSSQMYTFTFTWFTVASDSPVAYRHYMRIFLRKRMKQSGSRLVPRIFPAWITGLIPHSVLSVSQTFYGLSDSLSFSRPRPRFQSQVARTHTKRHVQHEDGVSLWFRKLAFVVSISLCKCLVIRGGHLSLRAPSKSEESLIDTHLLSTGHPFPRVPKHRRQS